MNPTNPNLPGFGDSLAPDEGLAADDPHRRAGIFRPVLPAPVGAPAQALRPGIVPATPEDFRAPLPAPPANPADAGRAVAPTPDEGGIRRGGAR